VADNTPLNPGTGGDVIASDDIAGVKHQRVKIQFGADGSATDVSSANPLPVSVTAITNTSDTTSTPLGIGATWTSTAFDTSTGGCFFTSFLLSDQAGIHYIDESVDNVTWSEIHGTATIANEVHLDQHTVHARYVRSRHTNGGVAQTTFKTICYLRQQGSTDTVGIDARYNAVHGESQHNTVTPGEEAFQVIGAIAKAAAPTYTEGYAVMPRVTLSGDTAITLDGEVVSANLAQYTPVSGRLPVDGSGVTQPVSGTFWQATQPVSGTVTASNTAGDVAHDGVDSGNPVKVGGIARTANPTAAAALDRVAAFYDTEGRQIVQPHAPRALTVHNNITLTTTAETTLIAAAAGIYHDLLGITVANSSATGTLVTVKDGTAGTTRFILYVPAGQTVGFMPPIPVTQSATNANWTATLGTGVTSVYIFAIAAKKTG